MIAVAAMVACTDINDSHTGLQNPAEPITFSFTCSVEPLASPTRSAYISRTFDDAMVTGVTVAVYDHASGALHYSRHFTSGFGAMAIKLHTGTEYDLYALANMGDQTANLPSERRALLSSFRYRVPSYADVNDKGIPMVGLVEGFTAGSGASTTFNMKRLFAMVTLNVVPEFDGGSADGIRVTDIRVGNGNSVLAPFGSSRMESVSERLPADDYASNASTAASGIVFYVPENMQGNIGTAVSSRYRNPDSDAAIAARKDMLTYVDVTVSAGSAYYTGTIHYRSYIGANSTDNFDIKSNCRYVWNMSLTEDGLVYDDWKVEQNITDGRYLRFTKARNYVKTGEEILWADILETNIRWEDLEKTWGGTLIYDGEPDATGFTVKGGVDGEVMSLVLQAARNPSMSLVSGTQFQVVDYPAAGISITGTVVVDYGSTASMTLRVVPANATIQQAGLVVVSGEDCISIPSTVNLAAGSASVTVSGLKPGTATVKAVTLDGSGLESNLCVVTVYDPVQSLEIRPATLNVPVGEVAAFSAVIIRADRSEEDVTQKSTWSLDNTNRATVFRDGNDVIQKGTYLCIAAGNVNVKASYTEKRPLASGQIIAPSTTKEAGATLRITSRPEIASIELLCGDQYAIYGSKMRSSEMIVNYANLPVRLHYANGTFYDTTIGTSGATLSSADVTVAEISGGGFMGNGIVNARVLKRGTTTITVTIGGCTDTFDLHVSEVDLTARSGYYYDNGTYQSYSGVGSSSIFLRCMITPYDATEALDYTNEVEWSSSSSWLAFDLYDGWERIRSTQSSGTDLITVSFDTALGSGTLTVGWRYASGSTATHVLQVSPQSKTLMVGETFQFTALYDGTATTLAS